MMVFIHMFPHTGGSGSSGVLLVPTALWWIPNSPPRVLVHVTLFTTCEKCPLAIDPCPARVRGFITVATFGNRVTLLKGVRSGGEEQRFPPGRRQSCCQDFPLWLASQVKRLVPLPVEGKAQSCGYMCLTCFVQPGALNQALVALPCWDAVRRLGALGTSGRDL